MLQNTDSQLFCPAIPKASRKIIGEAAQLDSGAASMASFLIRIIFEIIFEQREETFWPALLVNDRPYDDQSCSGRSRSVIASVLQRTSTIFYPVANKWSQRCFCCG